MSLSHAISFDEPTITACQYRLSEGSEQAMQVIWEHYFSRLVRLASKRLEHFPPRVADGEDIVVSAMSSFHRGMCNGRFPELADRDQLWRLLATITLRKASKHVRTQRAAKRGGGLVRGESVFRNVAPGSGDEGADGIDCMPGNSHSPDLLAIAAEECREMLDQLDDTMQEIVCRKLEGYSNDEIAEQLDVATRTVERKLSLIRRRWQARN